MHQQPTTIRRALISVSDKTNLIEFAKGLHQLNIELISTGGTSDLLRQHNIPVKDVAEITQFPEMMNGRLKTLHPKIHGGILGLREEHAGIASEHHIPWIDLVIVNLYPFKAVSEKKDTTFDVAIENIDIGGPTMLRAAAKNMGWVGVLVDPNDYQTVLLELQDQQSLSFATRKALAVKAFEHTAYYDQVIVNYLKPETLTLSLSKECDLRYGENPHQFASAYRLNETSSGVLSAKQWQGKPLSFNNLLDADAAYQCVSDFQEPTAVIIKHTIPCGIAMAHEIEEAFDAAFAADNLSAFGGIVALNKRCTESIATQVTNHFFEVLIAPGYTAGALKILAKKPNLRVLELSATHTNPSEFKFIEGGLLIQQKNMQAIDADAIKVVTEKKPTEAELTALLFSWRAIKHIKSNAILISQGTQSVGIGAGQVSRVGAVEIALKKAKHIPGTVLASDAFFPFRDSIDLLQGSGIQAIIQPGGSKQDQAVIDACNEHHIAMVLTGIRSFKH